MINVTGSLQIKNNFYHTVLSYKKDDKWKIKWFSTKIKAVKGNKKKAEAESEKIRLKFQEEINSDNIEDGKILFINFMKNWLKMIKSSVEETTYYGYEKLLNGRMTSYFEDKKIILQNIKAKDIQAFYQYLLEENLSGNTVKHYHAIIRKALQYAVRTDILLSNPADKVELPKIQPYNANYYSNKEILTLLKVIENTKLETPVLLGCYYGLRRSEIVGLKWSAIDFTGENIFINHTVTQITQNHSKKLVIKDKTKTRSSTRELPLQAVVKSYLLDLKEKQKQNRIICGNSYNEKYLDYICVDEAGNLLNPDYISHAFTKLLKRNNLKQIRFHDLRHSCASLLLAEGRNIKEIQAWLGHSNYNTTADIYAHLDSSALKESAKAISRALSIF